MIQVLIKQIKTLIQLISISALKSSACVSTSQMQSQGKLNMKTLGPQFRCPLYSKGSIRIYL